jgi:hypothetical protein
MVTDGLASYKSQAKKVFRRPLRAGKAVGGWCWLKA